jgi:hypothetical protein
MLTDHSLTEYLFYILLTWRLTVLLTFDLGPADVLVKIRATIGVYYDEYSERQGRNWIAKMLNCHFCASLWIGWFISLLWLRDWSFIIVGLVLSAGSLIINGVVPTV